MSSSDFHQSGINFNFNFCVFHLYLQQAIEMSQRLIKALAAAWEDPDPFDISPILFAISHLLAQISVGQLVPIDFNSWPTNSH